MSNVNDDANAASARQDHSDEVVVAPRTLHSCPHPWKAGDKTGPIQLCTTQNSEAHQRAILAILNRITDTNLGHTVKKATELLHPAEFNEEGPSLETLREDLVSMLFEKAQDEAIYIEDYATFLKEVSKNITNLPAVARQPSNNSQPRYGQLLVPLEEFVRLESVRRFEQLYDSLKTLYSNLEPWSEEKDSITRQKLVILMRFMILLYHQSMIPWGELTNVKETFARPLSDARDLFQGLLQGVVEDGVFLEDQPQDPPRPGVNCLAAEMLAVFLYYFGYLNRADRDGTRRRSDELCSILKRITQSLPTRQMYLVMRTLELKANGWRSEERLGGW